VSEHGSIIQTNIDHWSSAENEDILFSIKRRALSKQLLDKMKEPNEDELWKVRKNISLVLTYLFCFSSSYQPIQSTMI
jgi:hypothetical protein